MNTCRLVVRTSEGVWQGEVNAWTSWVVLASLAAQPETFAELAAAVRRYQPVHQLFEAPQLTQKIALALGESCCVIDLLGRTVVAGGGFELPASRGAYEADATDHAEGFPVIWLDSPQDWLFLQDSADPQEVIEGRAAARAKIQRVDARPVLFGLPMLEHLANNVLAATVQANVDEIHRQELTRRIHAAWLMAPRADLGGRTPREVLLAERQQINMDLQHRSDQWSMQKFAVPPLSPDSLAYRLGGFGTTEVVLYFDLMRALLAVGWELTRAEAGLTPALLVERLADFRDFWLQQPFEGGPLSPAELIACERRRMPVTSDGSHLDCDCPICQALADEEKFGPMFRFFDGHHLELEDEFAFSLCATRAEWEKQQAEYQSFSEEMDRKQRERIALGEGAEADDPLSSSVWQSTYVNWDALAELGVPSQQGLLNLGFLLAELVGNLKEQPDGAGVDLLKSLNAVYAHLRSSQEAAVRNSAAQEFRELLETVSEQCPDLTAKCADLQSRLDEVLRAFLQP